MALTEASITLAKSLNPLQKYRSYNYHHILIAFTDVAVLDYLNASIDERRWEHPNTVDPYTPICISGDDECKQGPRYVVLINTMTDANFLITEVNSTTQFFPTDAPNDVNRVARSAVATSGTMRILEPYGAKFLDVLASVGQDFGKAPELTMFVLKTIFVGYKADGSVDTITNINPHIFMIPNMAMSFDYTGTWYEIDLAPVVNGVSNQPTFANGAPVRATVTNPTLLSALSEIEKRLNEFSENASTKTHTNKITYRITLDEEFSNTKIHATNNQRGAAFEIIISSLASQTVSSLIESVVMMSDIVIDWKKEKDQTPPPKTMKTYKILSYSELKDDGILVKYHVQFYEVHVLPAANVGNQADQTDAEKLEADRLFAVEQQAAIANIITSSKSLNNFLEFDYIFSGNNTEILEMTMRINNSVNVMHSIYAARISPGGYQSMHAGMSTSDDVRRRGNVQISGPNVAGVTNIATPPKSTAESTSPHAPAVYQFSAFLSQMAGADNTSPTIKIVGNPLLMSSLAKIPKSLNGGNTTETDGVANNWDSNPAVVKINVYMPKSAELLGARKPVDGGEIEPVFRSSFWYDGLFMINEVTNSMVDGQFTQELRLIQLPTLGAVSAIENKPEASSTSSNIAKPGQTGPCKTKAAFRVPARINNESRIVNTNVLAFLATIRFAEHLSDDVKANKDYNLWYGRKYIDNLTQHPGFADSAHNNSAAGAYQFILKTWNGLKRNHPNEMPDFSANSQDRAAVLLLKEIRAYDLIVAGKITEAIYRCGAGVWASFPQGSPYDKKKPELGLQPFYCKDVLIAQYKENGGMVNS